MKSEQRVGSTALGVTDTTIVPISEAHITTLPIGDGKTLWLRTWGCATGTPVLFVHGGPGQCVADYNDINAKFFEASEFHVVEVDQRGTGSSQPSVRDDYKNMELYKDITIAQMSADFELVRASTPNRQVARLWRPPGSTSTTRCGTRSAASASFCAAFSSARSRSLRRSRAQTSGNERRLAEFDTFLELAAALAQRKGERCSTPTTRSGSSGCMKSCSGGDRQASATPSEQPDRGGRVEAHRPARDQRGGVCGGAERGFLRGATLPSPHRRGSRPLLGERLRALAGTDECPAVRTDRSGTATGAPRDVRAAARRRPDAAGVPLTAYFFEAGTRPNRTR